MNKEQQKKYNIPPLVIYVIMGLLVMVIVFPPLLRALLPDDDIIEEPVDKVALLKCSKTLDEEDHITDVVYKFNYFNTSLTRISLTYVTKVKETAPIDFVPDFGLEGYNNLQDVKVEKTEDTTKVTIDAAAFTSNPTNNLLKNYQKNMKEQEQFLKGSGYTCSITES